LFFVNNTCGSSGSSFWGLIYVEGAHKFTHGVTLNNNIDSGKAIGLESSKDKNRNGSEDTNRNSSEDINRNSSEDGDRNSGKDAHRKGGKNTNRNDRENAHGDTRAQAVRDRNGDEAADAVAVSGGLCPGEPHKAANFLELDRLHAVGDCGPIEDIRRDAATGGIVPSALDSSGEIGQPAADGGLHGPFRAVH
jgi:hypothetical protein